ncbi:hypothetical protein OG241_15770 [Streptomyces sp. NBC_01390]|uniref:hypothetical protein n=1 Tax=Streptomyces sp. NBC_01390 TaxID=2903850 RepID=UPI00324CE4E5
MDSGPVLISAHRKPQSVLLSAFDCDTEAYVRGDLGADTFVALAITRPRQISERRAG